MLEACISLRHAGEKAGKRRGDVLVAKLQPCAWGSEEWRYHMIVELDDPVLEQIMRSKGKTVQSYPYAVREAQPTGAIATTQRSAFRVKLDPFAGSDALNPVVRCDTPAGRARKVDLLFVAIREIL